MREWPPYPWYYVTWWWLDMVETVEPKRSDPGGWLLWIGGLVTTLALALMATMYWMGGDRTVNLAWIIFGVVALLMATLVLPGWAVIVNED